MSFVIAYTELYHHILIKYLSCYLLIHITLINCRQYGKHLLLKNCYVCI